MIKRFVKKDMKRARALDTPVIGRYAAAACYFGFRKR